MTEAVAAGRAAALSNVGMWVPVWALLMPAGELTDVYYTPAGDIVGGATNTRRFEVLNIGSYTTRVADGSAVVVAELELGAGDTAEADVPLEIPVDGGATFEPGDALVWKTIRVGTGPPDPGGCLAIRANGVGDPRPCGNPYGSVGDGSE